MRDTIYIWLSILVSIDRLSFVFLAQAKHIKSRKERGETEVCDSKFTIYVYNKCIRKACRLQKLVISAQRRQYC